MATFDTANDQIIFALHRTYADGSVSLDKDNVIVRKMSVGGDNHGLDEEKKSALNRGMLASFMGGDFVIQGFSSRDYYGGGQSIPYLYVYNPRLVQDNLPSRYNHMDYFSGSRKQLDKLMLSTQDGVMRTTFAAINDDKVSINQSNVGARTVFEGIPIASPKNGGCGLTTNGASACRSDDGDLAIILDGLGTILIPYENQGAQK
ncbi:hypothetical protein BOW53_15950 [Solemya pervernicosa gill symbiont]|uniref:Uncharacterized protein n=1 Tax=Solemya pervernicosa gill symbiont TaxID=642797 RepID=A0A1T2KZP8_9GAMM|nr:hypothetical protein [Solemya pervernicosa gill symbiont]OOZ38312.1 hypothetical protein BOW53_15950 [Solemya pervernicosa gill symbiont]